jgi:hypothetical protein
MGTPTLHGPISVPRVRALATGPRTFTLACPLRRAHTRRCFRPDPHQPLRSHLTTFFTVLMSRIRQNRRDLPHLLGDLLYVRRARGRAAIPPLPLSGAEQAVAGRAAAWEPTSNQAERAMLKPIPQRKCCFGSSSGAAGQQGSGVCWRRFL